MYIHIIIGHNHIDYHLCTLDTVVSSSLAANKPVEEDSEHKMKALKQVHTVYAFRTCVIIMTISQHVQPPCTSNLNAFYIFFFFISASKIKCIG